MPRIHSVCRGWGPSARLLEQGEMEQATGPTSKMLITLMHKQGTMLGRLTERRVLEPKLAGQHQKQQQWLKGIY